MGAKVVWKGVLIGESMVNVVVSFRPTPNRSRPSSHRPRRDYNIYHTFTYQHTFPNNLCSQYTFHNTILITYRYIFHTIHTHHNLTAQYTFPNNLSFQYIFHTILICQYTKHTHNLTHTINKRYSHHLFRHHPSTTHQPTSLPADKIHNNRTHELTHSDHGFRSLPAQKNNDTHHHRHNNI